jgi:hypothetical protein
MHRPPPLVTEQAAGRCTLAVKGQYAMFDITKTAVDETATASSTAPTRRR